MTVKNKREKLRFGIVGGISTSLDFGILFFLHSVGLPNIFANFISTSTAFCFSFAANRHYTFKAGDGDLKRHIILYIIVTLIGIWIIQPVIITLVDFLIRGHGLAAWQMLAIGKVCGTGVTLFWNYILYSRVVFNKEEEA